MARAFRFQRRVTAECQARAAGEVEAPEPEGLEPEGLPASMAVSPTSVVAEVRAV